MSVKWETPFKSSSPVLSSSQTIALLSSLVLEHAPCGILVYDESGQCVLANPAIAAAIGATIEQVKAQNFRNLESWKKSGLLELAESVLATGNPSAKVVQLISSFGKQVCLDCRFVPFQAEKKRFLTLIANDVSEKERLQAAVLTAEKKTSRDLRKLVKIRTRRVRNKAQCLQISNEKLNLAIKDLSKSNQELLQSQKLEAIGILAGGVAHDFNNSLMVIQCNASLLKHSNNQARDCPERLGEIESACIKAAELTRQLLIFSSKQEMREEIVDLNSLLRKLLKMLSRLIGENIKLKMLLCPQSAAFKGDPFQAEQVVVNLIINSRDAMPEGGNILIKTEIVQISAADCTRCRIPTPGEYIILTVSDTGCGIPEELIDRVFEPFFTTKPEGKGTGLGLPVVYGIVNRHNGVINVKSQVGQGTAFQIFLPAVPMISGNSLKKDPEKIEQGKGERILLIEDDPDILKMFSMLLTLNGYQVKTATSLKEAEVIFKNEFGDFRLLVLDMMLPDGNGLALAKRCKYQNPRLKVIFISGYFDQEKIRLEEIKAKGFRFISKPCEVEKMLKTIKEELQPR
ncbi:MAG: ATP-binding protein [Candidatus Wallbacteria bacterium]|nr:ATP-binding protein [Candidatus Wallbacteria bacterium]